MDSSNTESCQRRVDNEAQPTSGDAIATSTEFVMTVQTPDTVQWAAFDSVLAELDGPNDDPGGFELTAGEMEEIRLYDHKPRHAALIERWKATKQKKAEIQHQATNGHTATKNREIDAYRATEEGKTDYNANRKLKRHNEATAAGRTIKPRKSNPTKAERAKQKAASKANRSPAQVDLERKADSARKAESRKAKKEATQKALADRAIFS